MGTNYYAIPKLDDGLKQKIIDAVNQEQIKELKRLIPDEIHIGKSSWGWPFLFNHNHWDYYKDSKEMFEYLSKCEITDEYGRTVSYQEFKELVEEKQKEGLDKYKNSQWSDCYVYSNGYAYSTSTDFS